MSHPQANARSESIPQFDLSDQYAAVGAEIRTAIERVLSSQQFVLGREGAAFEEEIAVLCGVAHGVGVASGTDALILALRACGVQAGDEVLLPTYTFVATGSAVSALGAKPVFVDIRPETYNLDASELERRVTSRTRAIIAVHLYGLAADMDPILAFAKSRKLPLIEDCAQAIGALYKSRRAGSFGDAACFSFYPTKNLGALGDGGMVVTNDPALATALREVREYGWRDRYVSARIGINSRLDAIQAAVLGVKLRTLAADNARRQTIADRYDAGLAGLPLALPARRSDATHVFHQYVIRLAERDALRDRLRAAGIGTGIHYPVPVHRQPAYSGRLASGPSGLGVTERAAPQILSLPIYPQISDEALDRVIAEIRAFFR